MGNITKPRARRPTRGGKRVGAGRKAARDEATKQIRVYEADAEILQARGVTVAEALRLRLRPNS